MQFEDVARIAGITARRCSKVQVPGTPSLSFRTGFVSVQPRETWITNCRRTFGGLSLPHFTSAATWASKLANASIDLQLRCWRPAPSPRMLSSYSSRSKGLLECWSTGLGGFIQCQRFTRRPRVLRRPRCSRILVQGTIVLLWHGYCCQLLLDCGDGECGPRHPTSDS